MKTDMLFNSKPTRAGAAGTAGETLANEDFDYLRQLIYERSRISLGPEKRVLVTSRLAKRLRELQLDGYGEYCALLRSRPASRSCLS